MIVSYSSPSYTSQSNRKTLSQTPSTFYKIEVKKKKEKDEIYVAWFGQRICIKYGTKVVEETTLIGNVRKIAEEYNNIIARK